MGKHHRRKMTTDEIGALKLLALYHRGKGRRPRKPPRAESGTARRRRKAIERGLLVDLIGVAPQGVSVKVTGGFR